MNRLSRWALVLGAAVWCAGCAGTQNSSPAHQEAKAAAQPPAAEKPKDPQSGYEPRSEPGEGQKFLARMAGKWDVVKTFYPRGGGDPAVTKGTCAQKMIHAGKFLESDFVFQEKTGDSTGMGIIGFDAQTGKFTSFWTDARSTRVSVRQSEQGFDGQQIVLFSQTVGEATRSDRKSRTVTVLEDGDRTLIHRQYSDTPDGKSRLVMQLEMKRAR